MKTIIFATNNKHKLEEIQALLGSEFVLKSLKDIGFTGEIPETQPTLKGNALQKAKYIFDLYQKPCFADDTGLEVDALQGEPGVYSARYAGPLENFGTEEKRYNANIDKLLLKLKDENNRKAHFKTIIAYLQENGSPIFFEGIVNGEIINIKKGDKGFGYDPIFVPNGYTDTFAEMPLSEKNKISHRANAFNRFNEYLQNESQK